MAEQPEFGETPYEAAESGDVKLDRRVEHNRQVLEALARGYVVVHFILLAALSTCVQIAEHDPQSYSPVLVSLCSDLLEPVLWASSAAVPALLFMWIHCVRCRFRTLGVTLIDTSLTILQVFVAFPASM